MFSNKNLQVELECGSGGIAVQDLRTGRRWVPCSLPESLKMISAESVPGGVDFRLQDDGNQLMISGKIRLETDWSEMTLVLKAGGPMSEKTNYPAAWKTSKGDFLIVPLNEGISYPVDDSGVEPINLILFGGHGICMPWYGVTDGEQGWMSIVETPDDAGIDIARADGMLRIAPEWYPQKGKFAYERRMRFVFFDQGGYVAMAKRYRQYAKRTGLFKTLAEKRKERPDVDALVGAANIWVAWRDMESAAELMREMKALGMNRILWSTGGSGELVSELNDLGTLTSCYDIYQDAMNPEYFPRLKHVNQRWVTEAWHNDDIILDEQERHYTSWRVEAKDGERIACGVVCDRQILPYARKRIAADLKDKPFRARFIDTTTAARWRECYHPDHPMTRTECKRYRMGLLRYVSEETGIVCGAEAGHDAAVPYVDYFEGMLSLWPYRVPDSGHKPSKVYHKVPAAVAKFQTGHCYRLPLWELVYHDCVVSHWYWGDFNNKLPALWDRRDLFNVLYGTPPLFRFGKREWVDQQDRIVQSYQTTVPVARATGYSEMLSHEWLTDDHTVQRTHFANGVTVAVNFGEQPYKTTEGIEVLPMDCRVTGLSEQ